MMLAIQDYVREGFGTREYFNHTTVHPIALLALIGLCAATALLSRRWLLLPTLILACVVPQGQRIVVAGLDFSFMRVILLVAAARVFFRGEWRDVRPCPLDRAIIVWSVVAFVGAVLQIGNVGAVIFRAGLAYDMLAAYALCRVALREWEDIDRTVTWLIFLALGSVLFFLFEKKTGRNLFAIMGGVPEFSHVRNGKVRAQGPFVHAILAGCYWAVLLPLFGAKLRHPLLRHRALGVAGLIAIVAIVFACASSTPLMIVGCCGLGAMVYLLRHRMNQVRLATFTGLFALHLYMKQPVWHLIARIDVVGGSTGWHRYKLIQSAIDNFHEWWLCGIPSTAHWGYFMFDVTNQYVLEGVRSGFVAMLAFIWVFVWAYSHVGATWRTVTESRYLSSLSWGMGVATFAHMVVFLAVSISHAQQNLLVFFLIFGMIGSAWPTLEQRMATKDAERDADAAATSDDGAVGDRERRESDPRDGTLGAPLHA
ncbi:MAG: hypothetical protein R3F49_24585 [Planctomycetota bacterium]